MGVLERGKPVGDLFQRRERRGVRGVEVVEDDGEALRRPRPPGQKQSTGCA